VFPIPILDGGHLLFLAIEKLRGRPVSLTVQERSAQVSFVLLISLILVICANDISRFGLLDKLMSVIKR
jgi:regulator of sigma E protease